MRTEEKIDGQFPIDVVAKSMNVCENAKEKIMAFLREKPTMPVSPRKGGGGGHTTTTYYSPPKMLKLKDPIASTTHITSNTASTAIADVQSPPSMHPNIVEHPHLTDLLCSSSLPSGYDNGLIETTNDINNVNEIDEYY